MLLQLLLVQPTVGLLLSQPRLGARPLAQHRGVALRMAGVPPKGFEWGDREKGSPVEQGLQVVDSLLLSRVVRIANHAPTFASLSYFGLISMTMQSMTMPAVAVATLKSVLTRGIGPTSNKAFSMLFATPVTPAGFVFLIWPFISLLQLITVTFSALRPAAPLKQADLTALSLANVFATVWLLVSSNAAAGALPLLSCLVLPLVPVFSGYPLRSAAPPAGKYKLVFEVFSSFTTLASFLALAVELLHGGRVPFFGGRGELCALVFLSLTSAVVSLPNRCLAKKSVNLLALSGILWNRATSGGGLLSVSFAATLAVWGWAVKQLVTDN